MSADPTKQVKAFGRDPVAYAKRDPIAAGVLLTAGLVALSAIKSATRPDMRSIVPAAAAAGVFVVVAQVAPKQLGWVVLVGLFIMVWQNPGALGQQLDAARARLRV